ncbi:two-component regulator propeller domain-containing protein [Mangrovibacterium diazotrophicum]|uniref:Putative secreted protein (Por secretion system target) n=1 Tax=Mangrovibacterium diazotrophicum TaxID=1261403 RepID=A0A419W4Y2_9BACT|nr:two-component regulator propeller domain-containing protein [Mangrovibacterium diazotrophicum]RKD90531.1 putative secreted protein (Por secretion system target) [Mangrovibacterium diazotrophicum]
MTRSVLISILCCLVMCQKAGAQDSWTNYQSGTTGDSGLAGQWVFTFMEDDQNRLWIGTEGGISIKSSSGWQSFTTSDGLRVNEVGDIVMDHNNNIWIGYGSYYSGISVYSNGNFTHYSTNDHLINDKVEDLLVDTLGNVWIATRGGITKFNGSKWKSYTTITGLPTNDIRCMAQDRLGNIWIGTADKGVWVYNGETFSANSWESNSTEMIVDVYVDSENKVWALTLTKIYVFDGDKWVRLSPSKSGSVGVMRSVVEDHDGNYFFANTKGVAMYSDSGWRYFTVDDGLADNQNLSLFVDSSNIVYSGSERGYAIFDGEAWGVTTTEGLINSDVSDVFKDTEGKIWFCTHGGISILDGDEWESFFKTPDGDDVEWVSKGLQDSRGNYWFTTVNGIYKYDSTGWTIFDYKKDEMFTGWGQSIVEDHENNLWYGTLNGLLKYDGTSWTYYTTEDGFLSNYVDAVYEDSNHKIWFGTRGGISYWDGVEFTHDIVDIRGFSELVVYSFVEDSDNNLIASTMEGLLIYKDGKWDLLDGAPTVWFFDSYKDKNNLLWFASIVGLYKYDGSTFKLYSTDDGLVGDVVQGIYREEDTGIFWLSTSNGVSKLVPVIDAEVRSTKSAQLSQSVTIDTQGITKPFQFSVNGSEFVKNDGVIGDLEVGDYTFAITNAYDTLTINYSVQSLEPENTELSIYPNPTTGILTISGDQLDWVEVFTLTGQKLLRAMVSGSEKQIDISQYVNGIYLLKISGESGVHQFKVVKKE